jgi:hypothetical protein
MLKARSNQISVCRFRSDPINESKKERKFCQSREVGILMRIGWMSRLSLPRENDHISIYILLDPILID